MKATDLMVKDLVKVRPSGMVISVAAVHLKKVGYHSIASKLEWVRQDLLQPMELTPSFLEKNGFKPIDPIPSILDPNWLSGKTYRWEYADGVYVQVDFKESEPHAYISNRCYFASPYCPDVHSLQHAMKLCGIYKDMKL